MQLCPYPGLYQPNTPLHSSLLDFPLQNSDNMAKFPQCVADDIMKQVVLTLLVLLVPLLTPGPRAEHYSLPDQGPHQGQDTPALPSGHSHAPPLDDTVLRGMSGVVGVDAGCGGFGGCGGVGGGCDCGGGCGGYCGYGGGCWWVTNSSGGGGH